MEMPLVSVCMTTYNHEPYIAEAIESVLAQQTSFGVELVVGEDCSTDRTAAICREYAAKYPDRIRLVTSPENVGCSRRAAGNTWPTSTATTGGAIPGNCRCRPT